METFAKSNDFCIPLEVRITRYSLYSVIIEIEIIINIKVWLIIYVVNQVDHLRRESSRSFTS